MDRHYLRGYKVRATSEPGSPITFLASTEGIKRDGQTVATADWDLTNYRANPIVLIAHNYQSIPIGRTAKIEATDKGLVADLEFDLEDPLGAQIDSKIRRNFINAVSVGWIPMERSARRGSRAAGGKLDLLDISVVAVPADPQALALARSMFRTVRPTPNFVAAVRAMRPAEQEAFVRQLHQALVVKPIVRAAIVDHVTDRVVRRNS